MDDPTFRFVFPKDCLEVLYFICIIDLHDYLVEGKKVDQPLQTHIIIRGVRVDISKGVDIKGLFGPEFVRLTTT